MLELLGDDVTSASSKNVQTLFTGNKTGSDLLEHEYGITETDNQSVSGTAPEADFLDFTAALQQLPRFKPYSYPSDTIGELQDVESGIESSFERQATSSTESGKALAAELGIGASHETYTGKNARVTVPLSAFNVELKLLRGLRDIMYFRDHLLSAQLKVEDTERQLAATRASINVETRRIIRLARNPAASDILIRNELARVGMVLEPLQRDQEQDETLLADQQRQVTLQQGNLKSTTNGLYGDFTNGAQIGDSDPEIDGQMPQKLGSIISSETEGTFLLASNYDRSSLRTTLVGRNTNSAEVRSVSGLGGALEVAVQKPHRSELLQDNTISKASKATRFQNRNEESFRADIASFGSQHTETLDELKQAAELASTDPFLQENRNMTDVREEDLRPELLIDLILKSTDKEEIANLMRRGLSQKLNAIDGPPDRQMYDSIAMWGSSMSQNAITELIWTAFYHKPSSNSEARCMYELVDVQHWSSRALSIESIAMTDILRKLDIPTREIRIPKRPESLRVHYTADGSTRAQPHSQEQVPRVSSQDTLADAADDETDTGAKSVGPDTSTSPEDSTVLMAPESIDSRTETSVQTEVATEQSQIQHQHLVHRLKPARSLEMPRSYSEGRPRSRTQKSR